MAERNPSALWELIDEYPESNLSNDVGGYLAGQTREHQDRLAEGLDYLIDHSSDSFEQAGLADVGDAIPISYQEAPTIIHALSLYGRQRHMPNTRVVGYLNWPEYVDRSVADQTRKLLDAFIEEMPHVPFGYFENTEPMPVCIGDVRKLPMDLLQILVKDRALVTSRDSDMRAMNQTHYSDIYRHYREGKRIILPYTYNEPLPNHPNINSVMRWFDDQELRAMQDLIFEPGPAFGADDYRAIGGYGHTYLGETIDVVARIAQRYGIKIPEDCQAPEAWLALSSRRIASRLVGGVALENMWNGIGDFKATENYRKFTLEDLRAIPDISDDARDERIRETAPNILERVGAKNEFIEDGTAERIDLIFQLEAIRDRLGGPDDMFDFDNWRY